MAPLALWRDAPAPRHPASAVEWVYRAVPAVPPPIFRPLAAMGHWVMQSQQLRGIRRRAERSGVASA